MPPATIPKSSLIGRHTILLEDFVRGNSPLEAGGRRVDREQGIIYGVKVLGRFSENTHGEPGCTKGTEYTRQACLEAIGRYEGASVNTNHSFILDRMGRRQPTSRTVQEGIGQLRKVRISWDNPNSKDDGLYADLHLLTEDPFSSKLMEAAEKMPNRYGLSHDADGEGEVRDGWFVIERIPEVRGVDVVDKPATTRGLFENKQEKPMKKTLKAIIESRTNAELKAKFKPLLENEYCGGMTMEDPMTPGMAMEPPFRAHLGEAAKAMICDESLDDGMLHEMLGNLIKVLRPTAGGTGGSEDGNPFNKGGDSDKGDKEGEKSKKDGGGDSKKKPKEESDEGSGGEDKMKLESLEQKFDQVTKQLLESNATLTKEITSMKEAEQKRQAATEKTAKVTRLCESLDYKAPTATQLSTLQLLESEDQQKELIETFKKAAAPVSTQRKFGGASGRYVSLQESQQGQLLDIEKMSTTDFLGSLRKP